METNVPPRNEAWLSIAIVLPPFFASFFVAFGCWTLFAVAGIHLRTSLDLSGLQFALLLAMPMLSGGVLAIPAGIFAQKYGTRRVILACLGGLGVTLACLTFVSTFTGYLLVAVGLGLSGGLFSAGLLFLSSQAPARHLGLVLGLFSAGMLGAGFNYYLVSLVDEAFSWQVVPYAYLTLIVIVSSLFALLTEPQRPLYHSSMAESVRSNLKLLKQPEFLLLCLCYGFSAGGFIALALWLPDFLVLQYRQPLDTAARLAQAFIIPGALAQIAGGWLADRQGAIQVLRLSLMLTLPIAFLLSYPEMSLTIEGVSRPITLSIGFPLGIEIVLLTGLSLTMGVAIGSLLPLVVRRHPRHTAFAGGIVLLSGSSAAFLLPLLFGSSIELFGVPSTAFMLLFGFASVCLVLLVANVQKRGKRRALQGDLQLSQWW